MSKRLDIIVEEVTPLEFCEALELTTGDLVEAFRDRLIDSGDDPLALFYWLRSKYRG